MSSSKKYHRSRNRSSREHRRNAKRALRQAVVQQSVGLDGSHAAQFQIINLFVRVHRMYDRIDAAFAGEPFLPDLAPNAPTNAQRFNAYLEGYTRVTQLLAQAVELWMRACGMKKKDNWVPLLLETMRQTAAAKSVAAGDNQDTGNLFLRNKATK